MNIKLNEVYYEYHSLGKVLGVVTRFWVWLDQNGGREDKEEDKRDSRKGTNDSSRN